MIKIKNILIVAIASILIYACSSNSPFLPVFDHGAQALKDNDTLVKYLTSHYYDVSIDSIKPIVTGKTALIDDAKLKTQDIVFDNVDYKLYYYLTEQGIPDPVKGNPTVMDSVLTKYQGSQLTTSTVIEVFETQKVATWLTLDAVIKGWSSGFTHFKGGKNITTNGAITYQDTGKGFLFIPSGLGYRNRGNGTIYGNTCLVFRIELLDIVENTDHDNDGLASYLEIVDAVVEPNPTKVDSDGDFIPNYKDADDDNDGTPTIKEDANKDGDPRNDFSDPSNPTLPDYLNPKIK
ncbi:putative FKBP-type peptidyl-prolyl cis-trans isomerase FkpA [Polaribacter huanghezhanensis]|uniref:FKBP-type peptidyl-prolyl cis-trans isomerase n=1 Tax=Polaribacter huanghezhanensis TaxID=1354726 RepID=UPI0026487FD8|nr:FKBP-type peptidyl-prolyl cis-trans isomerase [Polaribacter huanghezhanensis]WKD86718.1 putative FKBP-type peptidyl-prolyl cis-trans isomerase FkpA [Polaribacter huanghezhanensis]